MANAHEIGQLVLIALGSNDISAWGDPAETVQKAMSELAEISEKPAINSRLYRTPAFPKGAGPDFVNAAMAIYTTLCAQDVLARLHKVEVAAGRHRRTRWEQRSLDVDLIAVGQQVLPSADVQSDWQDLPLDRQMTEAPDQLILPHPRLQDRAFVLVPLFDVAPDWQHPVLHQSIRALLAECPSEDVEAVTALN